MTSFKIYDNFFHHVLKISIYDFEKIFNFSEYGKNNKDQYNIFRHNFARFWYYTSKKERLQWIIASGSNKDDYDNYNKFIQFIYDVDSEYIDETFFGFKYTNDNFKSISKKESVNKLLLFKYDIVLFWLTLVDNEKEKLLCIINEFYNFNIRKEFIENEKFDIFNIENFINKWYESITCFDNNVQNFNPKIDNINNIHPDVKIINCINKKIKEFDNLPNGIKELNCQNNEIESLDFLPISLINLNCGNNKLNNLDNLPNNLECLKAYNNQITNINNFPSSLLYLNIDNCKISNIDILPPGLLYLSVKSNLIEIITNLPNTLLYLDISENNIKNICKLPKELKYLNIHNTTIDSIENLPPYLEQLICNESLLKNLNYIPTNLYELDFNKFGHYIEGLVPYGTNLNCKYSDKHEYIHYY
jgi:hypothetical protein